MNEGQKPPIEVQLGRPLRHTISEDGVFINIGINTPRTAVLSSDASLRALHQIMTIVVRQIVEITDKSAEWETQGISVQRVMNEAATNMAWAANITMMQPGGKLNPQHLENPQE